MLKYNLTLSGVVRCQVKSGVVKFNNNRRHLQIWPVLQV